MLWILSFAMVACNGSSRDSDSSVSGVAFCPYVVTDPDGDGWSYENGRSCMVPPVCKQPESDQVRDGWGWENGKSCRVVPKSHPIGKKPSDGKSPQPPQGMLLYDTTYYPRDDEYYPKTTCGDGKAHQEIYFAVTERSALWAGSCMNESWAPCSGGVCLQKWDQIPDDAKKMERGQKMVREPTCRVPCGRRHRIRSLDGSVETVAVIHDACPSQHWNNRLNEALIGRNPCAAGSRHVDLRKPLYLMLNKGVVAGNISVIIDPKPLP